MDSRASAHRTARGSGVGGWGVVKELCRRPCLERPPSESRLPRKEALRKSRLFHPGLTTATYSRD